MHFISWFIMLGILIGGLISKQYASVLAASIGMGLCAIADGLYFIGKTHEAKADNKEGKKNEESGND